MLPPFSKKGVGTGAVRRDVPPEMLASILLGMLRTRAREFGNAPAHMKSDAQMLDLFLHGAGARVIPGEHEADSE